MSVKVNTVLFFRVVHPTRAVVEVQEFLYATSQLAQTTLRSVLGQVELDGPLAQRERLNMQLQEILDKGTDPWGIKVAMVEVKHVDLLPEMQRTIAKQAEAEREKRAKVIHAEGEYLASEKLSKAAAIVGQHPLGVQLRYLQTLTEISTDKNSTIIFPLPMDLVEAFLGARERRRNLDSLRGPLAALNRPPRSGRERLDLSAVTRSQRHRRCQADAGLLATAASQKHAGCDEASR